MLTERDKMILMNYAEETPFGCLSCTEPDVLYSYGNCIGIDSFCDKCMLDYLYSIHAEDIAMENN